MKVHALIFVSALFFFVTASAQTLPYKDPYPFNVKQIHSGHSLTDPLFHPHWPGQYVNLMGIENGTPSYQLFNAMVGKSTIPGSGIRYRWENSTTLVPDARMGIADWELLSITERVPLMHEGGNTQQWYLDGINEQREYLSRFVNHAWNNGNNGNGAPTLLWSTWVHIDNSSGPFRSTLDVQGEEWERLQDYANANRPDGAPAVYMIPGHKMMARLYDDIDAGLVPGITNISDFFDDNIHTNELGAYAIALIHYACIFNKSPLEITHDLLPGAPAGTLKPTQALATYLQEMIWEVVTSYSRTGIYNILSVSKNELTVDFSVFPNPARDFVSIRFQQPDVSDQLNYTLLDATGKTILTGTGNHLDIRSLPAGYYFLKIGNRCKKMIKI